MGKGLMTIGRRITTKPSSWTRATFRHSFTVLGTSVLDSIYSYAFSALDFRRSCRVIYFGLCWGKIDHT